MDFLTQLIREVHKRPCLKNSTINSNFDIREKREAWCNICQRVYPDWHTWTVEEKNERGREVQRVWNSYRSRKKRMINEKYKFVNDKNIASIKDPLEKNNHNQNTLKKKVYDSDFLKINYKLLFNKLMESDESNKRYLSTFLHLYKEFSETSKLSLQTYMTEKCLFSSEIENTDEPLSQNQTMDFNLSSPKNIFLCDTKDGICLICDNDGKLLNINNHGNESNNCMLIAYFNIEFESVNCELSNYQICERCLGNIIAALDLKKPIKMEDNGKQKKFTENNDNEEAQQFDGDIDSSSEVNKDKNVENKNNDAGKGFVFNAEEVLPLSNMDLTCPICKENFETHEILVKHYHTHLRVLHCKECDFQFHSIGSFKHHISLVHKAKKFTCNMCNKVFITRYSARQHIQRVHQKKKMYCCTECPERFVNYYIREKHLNIMHGIVGPNHSCKVCSKVFSYSKNLREHIKSFHYQIKNFKCKECGKSFKCPTSLKNHLLSHMGIKNFKCDYCGKQYGRRYTIIEHLKIHTNLRNHVCEKCGKAFIQKCTLKDHLKTHEKSSSS